MRRVLKNQPADKQIILTSLVSLLFFFALALNVTPYLRGFAPMPQWLWQYRLAALHYALLLPLLVLFLILFTAKVLMNKSEQYFLSHERKLLSVVLLLCLLFQLSVIFASSGGLLIVLQRTIHPVIIGYFSAALTIHSLPSFLHNYPSTVSSYPNLAKYHPPGSILLFWLINQFSSLLMFVIKPPPTVQPSHVDLRPLWNSLSASEKIGALLSGYIVIFLASLTSLVMYYLGKLLYNPKVGMQAALLAIVIPAMTVFTPFNDVFSPLFTAVSFYFYLKGFKQGSSFAFLLSGAILFIGAFFTLTVLATLVIYAVVAASYALTKKLSMRKLLTYAIEFLAGFLILPLSLYFIVGFNSIASTTAILDSHLAFVKARQHQPLWLIYNYYDFFLFSGIPLLIVFLSQCKSAITFLAKKQYGLDVVFVGFCLMTLLLDLSGKMNGETGRTWTPFIPFLLLPLVNYVVKEEKQTNYYLFILLLQGIQVLILGTFLITVS